MDNIKLLVFDIDGTLVDVSKQTVEASAVTAINKAKANGYQILIATGRSFFFIHEDVKKSINTDYYVTVNGASLNDSNGSVIKQHGFDVESLKKLIAYGKQHDYDFAVKYAEYMGVYGNHKRFIERYAGLNHPAVAFLIKDNEENFFEKDEPLGVYMFAPVEKISELRKLIPDLSFVPGTKQSFEAVHPSVNKTKNIESVIKQLGLTWDNVMTFGDGHNDIEMLEKAHVGVAMGNAHDEVKQHADYVTDNILDDGIEKALKHFNII